MLSHSMFNFLISLFFALTVIPCPKQQELICLPLNNFDKCHWVSPRRVLSQAKQRQARWARTSGSHQTGQNEQPQFFESTIHSASSGIRHLFQDCRLVSSRTLPSWGPGDGIQTSQKCCKALLLRFSWVFFRLNIPLVAVRF